MPSPDTPQHNPSIESCLSLLTSRLEIAGKHGMGDATTERDLRVPRALQCYGA
jgi:hypothetical protein